MRETGWKMKKQIIITITTKFKKFESELFDVKEVEQSFHDAVYQFVEEQLVENEDFEGEIIGIMADKNELPEHVKDDFSDLGEIEIKITHEDIEETK